MGLLRRTRGRIYGTNNTSGPEVLAFSFGKACSFSFDLCMFSKECFRRIDAYRYDSGDIFVGRLSSGRVASFRFR